MALLIITILAARDIHTNARESRQLLHCRQLKVEKFDGAKMASRCASKSDVKGCRERIWLRVK